MAIWGDPGYEQCKKKTGSLGSKKKKAPKTRGKMKVLATYKHRLFTVKTSKDVGLGFPWYI